MAAGYRQAVAWIAANDDVNLGDDETGYILTVCLVADLFNKTDAEVGRDVCTARVKMEKALVDNK